MPNLFSYLFVFYAVSCIIGGQILFKKVAILIAGQGLGEILYNKKAIIYFMIAMFVYMSATFFWIAALRNLSLSRSYMFMALAFCIVPVLSKYIFDEELSRGFYLGALLISAGVYLTSVSR